jgi:hypothetical protein
MKLLISICLVCCACAFCHADDPTYRYNAGGSGFTDPTRLMLNVRDQTTIRFKVLPLGVTPSKSLYAVLTDSEGKLKAFRLVVPGVATTAKPEDRIGEIRDMFSDGQDRAMIDAAWGRLLPAMKELRDPDRKVGRYGTAQDAATQFYAIQNIVKARDLANGPASKAYEILKQLEDAIGTLSLSAPTRPEPSAPKPIEFDSSINKGGRWTENMAVKFVEVDPAAVPSDPPAHAPGFVVSLSRPGGTFQFGLSLGFFIAPQTRNDVETPVRDVFGNETTIGGKKLYSISRQEGVNAANKLSGFAGVTYLLPDQFRILPANLGFGRSGLLLGATFEDSPRVLFGTIQYLNRAESIAVTLGITWTQETRITGTPYPGGFLLEPLNKDKRWSSPQGPLFGLFYQVKL